MDVALAFVSTVNEPPATSNCGLLNVICALATPGEAPLSNSTTTEVALTTEQLRAARRLLEAPIFAEQENPGMKLDPKIVMVLDG